MAKRVTGPEIEKLIQLLAKVPGLGPRSARRAALHLVKKKDQLLGPLADAMGEAHRKVRICSCCGNVDTIDPCSVCSDDRRDNSVIIVVEDVSDLWALERAGAMNTAYHVLGGTLSPLDGVGPDDLNIQGLVERVSKGGVRELIIAVNATVEARPRPITSPTSSTASTSRSPACARRAGRRRTGLSGRRHADSGTAGEDGDLRKVMLAKDSLSSSTDTGATANSTAKRKAAIASSVIPVPVTGIQPRDVRRVDDSFAPWTWRGWIPASRARMTERGMAPSQTEKSPLKCSKARHTLAMIVAALIALTPLPALAASKAETEAQFRQWLQTDLWPQAQKSGISAAAFKAAFADVKLNWDLPDLVPPGTKPPGEQKQSQAEFSSPALTSPNSGCKGWRQPDAALPRKMPRRSGGSKRPTAFRVRSSLPSGAANPVSAGQRSRIRSWTCSPPRPSCRRVAICSNAN